MKRYQPTPALKIALIYFLVSGVYIVYSDALLLNIFKNYNSGELLSKMQSYKGIVFVLLTSIILFFLIRKSDKKNQKQLAIIKKNREQYGNLYKNMSQGVIYSNPKGKALSANQACLAVLGLTEKKMLSLKSVDDYWKSIHQDGSLFKLEEHPTERALKIGKPVNDVIMGVFHQKSNQYKWLSVSSVPEFKEGEDKPFRVFTTFDDITNLKNYQDKLEKSLDKLAKSEFLLKEASRIAKVGAWEYDKVTDQIAWSEQVFKLFGFETSEQTPSYKYILDAYTDDSKELLLKAAKECNKIGKPYDLELRLENDNKQYWVRVIGYPVYDNDKKIVGRRGILQDITAQKKTADKIKEANTRYRLLANHTSDLICLHNTDLTFSYLSPSVTPLLGYKQEELVGKTIYDLVHPKDATILDKAHEQVAVMGKAVEAVTYRVMKKTGEYIWFESLANPIKENKIVKGYVSACRDISQWMKAKTAIQNHQQSLQNLTTEISLIEEKQKKQIAANIHDHLSQSLVIAKMKLSDLEKNTQLDFIKDELLFIKNHLTDALENSRKITYELSPPILYQLGIIETMHWFFAEVEEKYQIKTTFASNISSIALNEGKLILIYRSIQEITTNIIKHAKATKITVTFNKNNNELTIDVTDNGIGFDVYNTFKNNALASGFGLFTIQERIKNLKGKVVITSKINKGTTVNIFVPL